MKLRRIAEIIKDVDLNLIIMELKNRKVGNNNQNYYFYEKRQKNELKKILEIPFLSKKYGNIFEELLTTILDEFPFEQKYITMSNILRDISKTCEFYLENFYLIYPELDSTSLSIKLPITKNLEELGKYYVKIDKLLNQILANDIINGNVQFKNTDVGSSWIDISVGSTIGMTVLGAVVYAACYIRNQNLKFKLVEQEYEKAKLGTEALKILIDANKKLINSYVELETKNIINEYYDENDRELHNRVKNTIYEFSAMIDKGLEVHPALEVANEIKTEYPNFNNLIEVVSKVKEITNQAK